MASAYPGALDALATNMTNASPLTNVHPAHHNDMADAINKIEAELGVNPSGTFATLLARIVAIEDKLAILQPASPSVYTHSNVTTDRTLDANATTMDELADNLGTLIVDLRARGIVG